MFNEKVKINIPIAQMRLHISEIPQKNVLCLMHMHPEIELLYVKKGKIRNRRKVLLGLSIGFYIPMIIMLVSSMVMALSGLNGMDEMLLGSALAVFLLCVLVLLVISAVFAVFTYIAYYDYLVSCDPGNAVLYLVLSIFIPVTRPFFLFFSCKKDLGMPPRKQVQTPEAEIVELAPAEEMPEEFVEDDTTGETVPVENDPEEI